jgi:four helix bundle protein
MNSFRDLIVWQKAMGLVKIIYDVTNNFSSSERYGLTDQIRRSAVSIPSNIAEGYGRGSTNDYIRFLTIARGSLFELETQAEIGLSLNYMSDTDFKIVINQSIEI